MAELVIHPNLYTIKRRRRSFQSSVPPLLRADQAEQRYLSAVQAAVEKCAADTAGQTCFICMDGAAAEGLVRGCSCRGGAGFAHVSCLARGAQAAVERDADTGWARWHTCGLCKQEYHGVVRCALGWACWKTYVGRPETHWTRRFAMSVLGNGLDDAGHHEDALSVREAELSMERRLGGPEANLLIVQGYLANSYAELGRLEDALNLYRDVYSRELKLYGAEHSEALTSASNYAASLVELKRFEEAKSLLLKTMPVARRVLGESDETTLTMRVNYAQALYEDPDATLDDLREAVTTLEDTERIARRVLGGAHPLTLDTEDDLRNARAALRASALSSKATEDTCRRLREEIAQLKAENAELRRHRINNNIS